MRQVLLRCVLITDSFYVVFLLINVKMQTIVGNLTFMNGKNSTLGLSEQKKKKKAEFLDIFILMSIYNFMLD